MPDCTAGFRCLGVDPIDQIRVPPLFGVSADATAAASASATAPRLVVKLLGLFIRILLWSDFAGRCGLARSERMAPPAPTIHDLMVLI